MLVLLSENAASYREAEERMRGYLRAQGSSIELRTVPAEEFGEARSALPDCDILLAVGTRAMEAAAKANKPVLNILVPQQNYELLRSVSQRDASMFSAIYLDQPLSRHLRLIKQILPNRRSIGVVLGPATLDRIKPLQQAAREQQLTLDIEQIASQEEIIPALTRLQANDRVLLALPDPLVFNKNTAQSILLTSYRAQTPLIAYSNAYVKAGALAAVYSTPAQIGQQAAETLLRAFQTKNFLLPAPQHPKYFSVSVNYPVGRSMGFVLQDEAILLERIKAGAERE